MEIKTTTEEVNWNRVASILSAAGLSQDDGDTLKTVFERSYGVAFAYDGPLLIGCGRVLSDGLRQAAIYNIAVDEAYRGQQLGRAVIESLLEQVKGCTVTLYTHPKTVRLYEKFGFRRQKTGMVLYGVGAETLSWMEDEGFLLPGGYRFGDNDYEREHAPGTGL
ncbi:MAG: acetyltransferase family protein [Oscillospiraceae bacterium]|nr:acetyltransferase family protein [Oscillospiraceae bacterium]